MNDIYSRLLAGESMDAIMESITKEANDAQARYNEEMAAKAAAEAKAANKTKDFAVLLEQMCDYLGTYYPDYGVTKEDATEETAAEIVKILDKSVVNYKRMGDSWSTLWKMVL